MSRAFERPVKSIDCSKRTEYLKQKTIYKSLVDQSNARTLYPNTASNQWTKKGSINYTFTNGTATGPPGCLKAAHSYELLLDAVKGKSLVNPVLNANTVGSGPQWIAPFIQREGGISEYISRTDISGGQTIVYDLSGGIPNRVPTEPDYTGDDMSLNPTNYPGYVIGKDYVITPCIAESNYLNVSDVSLNIGFKWTQEYWNISTVDTFNSLQYQKSISLLQQPTDLSSYAVRRRAPQPRMDVSNNPIEQLNKFCNYSPPTPTPTNYTYKWSGLYSGGSVTHSSGIYTISNSTIIDSATAYFAASSNTYYGNALYTSGPIITITDKSNNNNAVSGYLFDNSGKIYFVEENSNTISWFTSNIEVYITISGITQLYTYKIISEFDVSSSEPTYLISFPY